MVAAGVQAGADCFPVVGLSLGAAVAVTAAIHHPEHVSALILTVGLAHPDPQSSAFTALWRRLEALGEWEALAQLMILSTGTAGLLSELSETTIADAISAFPSTYPSGGGSHAELARRTDVTALLSEVNVPTLVVVGGQDRIVLPRTAREFGRIAGSVIIEYDDAGHIFAPAQAARWSEHVHAFLDHLPPV